MSGGLLPETVRALREARACSPLFSNMILSEAFAVRARRGHLTILPRTDGLFALVDERRPMGERTLSVHPREVAAIGARDARFGHERAA